MARTLIVAGLVLVALGLLLQLSPGLPWLGKLPGDIRIERPGVRIYVPIVSCLVLSALLTVGMWLFSKLR